MKLFYTSRLLVFTLIYAAVLYPTRTIAEDIDIFVGGSGVATKANVLIVIDNTSNWSAQNQHWPDGLAQGQSEVRAIKNVIGTITDASINIGLMAYVTGSGSGNDGGYIRQAVEAMDADNKVLFSQKLDTIFNHINDPAEKVGSNMPYGNLMFDVFKYFGGYTSPILAAENKAGSPTDSMHFGPLAYADTAKVPASLADTDGYSSKYTEFKPPFGEGDNCVKNYIIFIGNGFPNADNTTLLSNVGGDISRIALEDYQETVTPGTCTDRGYSDTCVNNNACSTSPFVAAADNTLQCGTDSISCGGGKRKYMVQECTPTITSGTPTGTLSFAAANKERYADEWARFLYQTDVNAAAGQQNVITYAIDVYKDQQSADQTALLRSMAKNGGGAYFAATNENAIVDALKKIFIEIQGVNSTFASASLPVNATNRAQNENQVFIGMFRPDPEAKPRWPGNLKKYKLVQSGAYVELGDEFGALAVDTQTGFISDCAISGWTQDSPLNPLDKSAGYYWKDVKVNPSVAGKCTTSPSDKYSDLPDGPIVEKGAAAEVIRRGNRPGSPDSVLRRTIYTLLGDSLVPMTSANAGLSTNDYDFIIGKDVNDENSNGNLTEPRPSLHGDVIHSRPLPINYGTGAGVTVYYGANDGTLRSVNAESGVENWAFIAPEFNSKLSRLRTNSPLVNYSKISEIDPTAKAKDYFFDGGIGIYQNADNSNVWIYPTMRRGGRMIYAFNVTNSGTPVFKWKAGCPNITNDDGCTEGIEGIGQTWSTPNAAFIKGYPDGPVLVVGGGYDNCEDEDNSSPSCSDAKGKAVYVIDANTGKVIKSFSTEASVPADVALIDVDNDAKVDFAYATDTRGNIYRINFIDPSTKNALSSGDWKMYKIAKTDGDGRKFLYPPALLQAPNNKVYLAISSGDREHPLQTQYPYTKVSNRFYVFLDDTTKEDTFDLDDTGTDRMFNYTATTSCASTGVLPATTMKGWFMDLSAGEQGVGSAVIAGGLVTFSTNRPVPASADSCAPALGEARGYWVNLFNGSGAIGVSGSCDGSRSSIFVGGGLPPSPVMGTVPIDGKPTTVIIGAPQKTGGASSQYSPQQVKPLIKSKRKMKYWKSSGDN
jgi:type IV pilus assembly protein PilY1